MVTLLSRYGVAATAGLVMAATAGATTLADAVQAGLARDAQVSAASHTALRAQAELDTARNGRYPVFSAKAGTTGVGGNTYAVMLTQKLYDWGRTDLRIEAADAAARGETHALDRAREEVALAIATTYLDVLTLQGREAAAREQLARLATLATLAQTRVAGGYAEQGEFVRVLSESSRMQEQLAQLSSQGRAARRQFAELTGLSVAALQWPTEVDVLAREDELDGLVDQAPGVRQSQAEWESSKSLAAEADVAMWPQLELQVSRTRTLVGGEFYADSSVGVNFTIEALQGTSSWDRAKAERLRQESAADKVAQSRRDLRRKAYTLFETAVAARARAPLVDQRVNQLAELQSFYESQFQAGRRSFNELLSLTVERYDAERQSLELRDQAVRAPLELAASLGQLVPWLVPRDEGGTRP